MLRPLLMPRVAAVIARLALPGFSADFTECTVIEMGAGGFYQAHSDSGPGNDRRVTFVFYFEMAASEFVGGDLLIYDYARGVRATPLNRAYSRITPKPNRLLWFPSDALHEVEVVRRHGSSELGGGFAVVGHISALGRLRFDQSFPRLAGAFASLAISCSPSFRSDALADTDRCRHPT